MLQWWACRAVNRQHYRLTLFSLHLCVVITLTGRRGNTWWNRRWRSVSCCRQWWASFNKHQHPENISRRKAASIKEACAEAGGPRKARRRFPFSYDIIWKSYTFLSLPLCLETNRRLYMRLKYELTAPLRAPSAPKHPLFPETWAWDQ